MNPTYQLLFKHVWGALALLVLLWTSAAHADPASEARVHYDRALKFYDDGVYDAALVELTRAYDLNPSYRILYNIAQARVAMRDYAGAVETFQRYLRDGAGQVSNERVSMVRTQLTELQQRIGTLTIETDVAGSEVLVDDVVVGVAPLAAPVSVNAGVRRVTVRHPDHAARSERVSVAGGEQLRAALPLRAGAASQSVAQLAPSETPPPSAAEPALEADSAPASPQYTSAQTEPAPPSRTTAWVMTGVTGAFAATALVFAIIANGKDNDLDERRTQPDQSVAQFNADRDTMKRMALLSDGFTIAALASAGITTWLWLRDDGRSERADAARGVRVALGLGSAQLRGEF